MRFIVVITAASVTSCAVISHDVTKDPVAARISGRCFALAEDAYVVNTGGIGVRDALYVPDGRCRAPDSTLNAFCVASVKARVPRGTTLSVTQVVNHADGENGRCWRVFARLDRTVGVDHDVEVPSCWSHTLGPIWVTPSTPSDASAIDFRSERLTPCETSTP
jgi:hypothetical protein